MKKLGSNYHNIAVKELVTKTQRTPAQTVIIIGRISCT